MEDWQERLIAEYNELNTRCNKLIEFINTNPVTKTPRTLFTAQLRAMKKYSDILYYRMLIEGITSAEHNN
jgi:hypothetical protein